MTDTEMFFGPVDQEDPLFGESCVGRVVATPVTQPVLRPATPEDWEQAADVAREWIAESGWSE